MPKLDFKGYIHLLDRMLERKGLAEIERDAIFNDDENIELVTKAFEKRIPPQQILDKIDQRPVDAMYAEMREVTESLNEAGWDSFWDQEDAITVGDKKLNLRYYVVYDTPNNLDLIVAVPASEINKLGYDVSEDLQLWNHGGEYFWEDPQDDWGDEEYEELMVNVREIGDDEAYELVTNDPTAPPMEWKKNYTPEEFEDLLRREQILMNKRRKLVKESLNEAKKKPNTKAGKDRKFKKVMKEFGKGKLKPYHADEPLKSKKQNGSKKAHKQALAIAFSEAGMKKEVYEAREMPSEFPEGQKYAIDFLTASGFKFISTPLQASRGNLMFQDPEGTIWGIFKNGGYIRKMTEPKGRWQVVQRLNDNATPIDDDEYMDLVHIITEKYRSNKLRNKKAREDWGGPVKFYYVQKKKDGVQVARTFVNKDLIKKSVTDLMREGFKNINIIGHDQDGFHGAEGKIEIIGNKSEGDISIRKYIRFGGGYNPGISYLDISYTYNHHNTNNVLTDEEINKFL